MLKGDIELLSVNKTDKLDFRKEEQTKEAVLLFKGILGEKQVELKIKLEMNHVQNLLYELNLFQSHSIATLILKRSEQQKLDAHINDEKPLKSLVGKEDAESIVENNKIPAQEEPEEEFDENDDYENDDLEKIIEIPPTPEEIEKEIAHDTPETELNRIEIAEESELDETGEYKGYESKKAYERAELMKEQQRMIDEENAQAKKKGKGKKKK